MECGKQNIKIVEGNEFALVLPLKQRTFVASTPIDEDIVYADLQDVVLKIGDTQFTATLETYGVQVLVPYNALTRGTYDILLTATYHGSVIRASYFEALTIVQYNSQSDAQQYIAGSPIVLDAAYVIGGTLTDAELEALKEEYREKNAQLQQAIEDAEAAKAEWEQKAADLDGVAQESTSQEILTAVENIDIDTSDLAKEATLGTPLVGQPSTIFGAIAQSGQDSKQTIVDAINQMGGSATTNMTWAQLAAQIGMLPVADIRGIEFLPTYPNPPYDILRLTQNTGVSYGIRSIINDTIKNLNASSYNTSFWCNNSDLEYIELRELTNVYGNGFLGTNANLRKAIFPKLLSGVTNMFVSCGNLNVVNTINIASWNFTPQNCTRLIDLIIGRGFTSNISVLYYNPTEAYRSDSNSLCFDTDLEEYGRTFATNWEKWKWCIINHFAANLQDRTGMSAFTISRGGGSGNYLSHFDAEMIAAFTDKNWTLA